MKSRLKFTLIAAMGLITLSCTAQIDLINDEFPEAEQEVMETFGAIAQSIKDKDLDKLISFHAYGPKFTEFKNGEPRNGDKANETHERNVFGSVSEVVKFDANDLKIAVYGDVANVTFHSDFHLKFGEDLIVVNDQITLLFVKTDDGWKMVHEHHSPLAKNETK
ncbi:YybH family protein [Psychroserpens sp.]|uniref:YybH family protein n=1 Tax=Psychroserpens sp. TaxID=2020870 RepID=UPI001B282F3D|nr:nuclear transport factor 2 family protein [Psychroserpens sp.]MBO6606101.1 nuclear transport factor 2 family protein [Psychroserpens sp.]MBO6630609.1 nuclear transport factor 2 family protein [Psychroserpens sp.]MBO6652528.1 nuclear transport factor 2 family protein [Psychroserpens sp.]MBO6681700.1 nuclear transport factor 2 family protein [Psychroserpens sp.]MBO6749475.1 nuclear transport factor 2 family protein [Psychroserpens sp.]